MGTLIMPKVADLTLSIPCIQVTMSYIQSFSLTLTLREEGKTVVQTTIMLN